MTVSTWYLSQTCACLCVTGRVHTSPPQLSGDLPFPWLLRAPPGKPSTVQGDAVHGSSDDQRQPSTSQPPSRPHEPGRSQDNKASILPLGTPGLLWLSSHLGAHTMVVPHPDSSPVSEPGSDRAKLWTSPPYSADLLPENVKEFEPHSMTSSCLKPDISLKMPCGLSNGQG